jgi:phosphate-selective porin OprO/OprP
MNEWILLLGMLAQTPQAAPAPPVTAGWEDGFVIQSPDGANRIVLGATIQVDGRFSFDDPAATTSTFTIRKARPTISGRVAKYFEFKLMPDFGNGTATVFDAYVDVRFTPRIRVRSGKDKTPVGYELLQGDAYLLFPERALASSLVPNRDVGFQAIADPSPKLSFSGGIFNGVPDGASSSADVDTNGSKDVAGRITWQPFRRATGTAGRANGLGLQIGGSTGAQAGPLPTFRTSIGQTYFSYAAGTAASGDRRRVSPALFYYYKSFGAFAEYMRTTQQVARAGNSYDVTNDGWEVTGSYVFTGEAASDRGVHPAHPLDPSTGQWGAFQVVARYSQLRVDPLAFEHGLAAQAASAKASAFAAGADWYPVAIVKYYVMIERTTFSGGSSARPAENVLILRMQLAF